MSDKDIDELLEGVKKRYFEVASEFAEVYRESLVAHVKSLASWYKPSKQPPPEIPARFPSTIAVAYAVCHLGCETKEFIVDGSTQECQYCGSLMYRMETAEYKITDPLAESEV